MNYTQGLSQKTRRILRGRDGGHRSSRPWPRNWSVRFWGRSNTSTQIHQILCFWKLMVRGSMEPTLRLLHGIENGPRARKKVLSAIWHVVAGILQSDASFKPSIRLERGFLRWCSNDFPKTPELEGLRD